MRKNTRLKGAPWPWTDLTIAAALGLFLALSASARDFFVDNEAAGIADGSSWTNAWTRFSAVAWSEISPGDTLYISGGKVSKNYEEDLIVGRSGAPGQPVTITIAASDPEHNGMVELDGHYIDLIHRQYVTLSGNVNGSPHLQLLNFFSTDERTHGNAIAADASVGCTFEYIGASNVNQVVSLVAATGFVVRHCSATDVRGDAAVRAVNCYGGGSDANLVENNTFVLSRDVSTGYGPDGVQGSDSLTIRNNYFTVKNVEYFTSGQHTDYCQVTGNNLIICGNEFVNIGDSAVDMDWWVNPTPHDIWIYNNVFRITGNFDPYPEYIRFYSSGAPVLSITNLKILNNTFVDNPWLAITGPGSNASGAACTGFEIKNNLFMNRGANLWIYDSPNFTPDSFAFAYNIYASGSIMFRGTNFNIASTWPAIEPTRIAAQPKLVCYLHNSSGNDFHPALDDSVARNSGEDLSAFFGIDKDGTVRPAGAPWDVGAYQAGLQPPAGDPPVITVQPASLAVVRGASATFTVTASGPDLTYQWRFNDVEIPGATSSQHTEPSVRESDLGQFRVQVSNVAGCVLSESAILTFFADSDGDGLTDDWERGVGRYQLVQGGFTWDDAKKDAETRGGHLATFVSEAEWNSVRLLVPDLLTEPRWIGLRREADSADFNWITGEPLGFTMWAADRPDTADKSAAVVELTTDGLWKDTTQLDATHHSYLLELGFYTDPANPDTDGDGFSDGDETNFYHTLPNSAISRPIPTLTSGGITESGAFLFFAHGPVGAVYVIETSTNLVEWLPFLEITLTAPSVPLGDLGPDALPGPRYYRATPKPETSSD